MRPTKMKMPIIAVAIMCFAFIGCTNFETTESGLERIGSSKEVSALSSFIVIGETTYAQVKNELGEPVFSQERTDGGLNVVYRWTTNTNVREVVENEEDLGSYFDPFTEPEKDLTSNNAYLYLRFEHGGVVESLQIVGPEES